MMTRIFIGLFLLAGGMGKASFSMKPYGNNADSIPLREIIQTHNTTLIPKMTDEQLVLLINMLFEMDSIPSDLVSEIGKTVKQRSLENHAISEPENEKVKPISLTLYESSTPAAEFYSVFESKHLFPVEDVWKKSDTTYVIDLFPEGHNGFFLPTCNIISSPFGWRGDTAMHNGTDLDLNKGDPVVSAWDGVVRIAGKHGNYGNVIIIRHYNGLETTYGHLWKIKVKPGQQVKAGQCIGLGGSTGRSTGSHLHWETRFKGQAINPKYFVSFNTEKPMGKFMVIRKTRIGMCAYPKNAVYHQVEKGDNIWEIAKRYGKSISAIKELNGVSGKSFKIKPGMKVKVG